VVIDAVSERIGTGMARRLIILLLACFGVSLTAARADDVKVLTAGAMKPVLLAVADEFQKVSGHTLSVDNDTVGALTKRIEGGAAFDLAVLTPAANEELSKAGKIMRASDLARVGISVIVKAGAPQPDISTLAAFKQALLQAKSIAYIDPASGGSSGIYLAGLFQRLGIADALKPKTKLKRGGSTADLIASGEAELALQQNSEIAFAPGVTLVGPLPAEIQNYTTYAAGISTKPQSPNAALALVAWLMRPAMAPILQAKGLLPPS
jgi:molybdate transport system substrate-binding protein